MSAAPAQAKQQDECPLRTKLVGAVFVNSVSFAGEVQSVTLKRNCDSIEIADDMPGIYLRRVQGTPPKRYVAQSFVPWTNVKELLYGE